MRLAELKGPIENEHNVVVVRRGGPIVCVCVLIDKCACLLLITCVFVICCMLVTY